MPLKWSDFRDAARSLARVPALSLSAILCLGLGLGATTAIYSAVDRVLLQRMPFPEPERLVTVFRTTPHFNSGPFSAPNYADLAQGRRTIASMAAASPTTVLISGHDFALRETGYLVTGNFFPMLGASAERGRMLTEVDTAASAPPAVVVSDELWRSKLGADSTLVGHTIVVDGTSRTVVGIAPRDFRVMHGGRVIQASVWLPVSFTPNQLADRGSNYLSVMGRLAPGSSVAAADAELHAAFDVLLQTWPAFKGEQVQVVPMQAEGARQVKTPLLLVLGAVGFVLLVAVGNVASLLLARGVQRRREMAIRTALGGGRWAVMRPVIAESLVLAGVGAALGLGLALLGVRTIGRIAGSSVIPQLNGLSIDLRIIGFATLLTLVVSLLCSAAPAWSASSVDPQDALRGGRGGPGRQHHRALGALVGRGARAIRGAPARRRARHEGLRQPDGPRAGLRNDESVYRRAHGGARELSEG